MNFNEALSKMSNEKNQALRDEQREADAIATKQKQLASEEDFKELVDNVSVAKHKFDSPVLNNFNAKTTRTVLNKIQSCSHYASSSTEYFFRKYGHDYVFSQEQKDYMCERGVKESDFNRARGRTRTLNTMVFLDASIAAVIVTIALSLTINIYLFWFLFPSVIAGFMDVLGSVVEVTFLAIISTAILTLIMAGIYTLITKMYRNFTVNYSVFNFAPLPKDFTLSESAENMTWEETKTKIVDDSDVLKTFQRGQARRKATTILLSDVLNNKKKGD